MCCPSCSQESSHEESYDLHFELLRDAARFEPGTLNLAGLFGLGAELELLPEEGAVTVAACILALTGTFAAGLRERGLDAFGNPVAKD